jgi:diguanylate cyclase (GGDEF)-like protein
MPRRSEDAHARGRWLKVLLLVVAILGVVGQQNIALHGRGETGSGSQALLGELDLLLHEESDLQWQTLAGRDAPVRVAREVRTVRLREQAILGQLGRTLPAGSLARLHSMADGYHTTLDQELALLVLGRSAEALGLERRTTDPLFRALSQAISDLAHQSRASARRANQTANLALIAALVLSALMIGLLLRRFDRAHQAAVRAGMRLLQQERTALQQARASEAVIKRQALHDALTGLANRTLFTERVTAAVGDSHSTASVLFVDLDDFKRVNDSLGHAAGDELLAGVAGRLQGCVRDVDTAARLGGDEFAVLLADGGTQVATQVAARIIAAVGQPFVIGDTRVLVGASIGIAAADGRRGSAELLRDADVAMYMAKGQGKGRYTVFEASMGGRYRDRLTLEADLREAVERGQLTVHYQPILSLREHRITGAEALVRWAHPTRGRLGPGAFLQVAEEVGLIHAIDRQVLRQACRQARDWAHANGGSPFAIHVNLSATELAHPGLVEDVAQALGDAGLDPGSLVLEITESAMLPDGDETMDVLLRLRGLGLQLALDDFGTGYASLIQLQRFPITHIKIDKSFVDQLAADPGVPMVKAIVQLGRTLGLRVVAEGIETLEQARRLEALGCTSGQGYLFSRPLEAAALTALLGRTAEPAVGHATGR